MINNFLIIWQQRDIVLAGLLNTVILLVISGVASLVLGALLTPLLMSENKAVSRAAVGAYEKATAHMPDDDEGRMIELVSRPK